MKLQSLPSRPSVLQTGLIILAVVAGFILAAPVFIYPFSYFLLIVWGSIAAAMTVVACFAKHVWALYAAIFVVLLPTGLIPPYIHSMLNRSLTVIAFVTWVFAVITRERRLKWTLSTSMMLAFLIWTIVTLFWARNLDRGTTIIQAYALRLILFLLLVPSQIRTQKELNGVMKTMALNGWVLMIASGVIMLYTGYDPQTRFQTADMGANGWGLSAVMMLIGVFWWAMHPSNLNRKLKKITALIFLMMTIALTGLTASRGSAISLLITLLMFCCWKPTRPWGLIGLIIVVLGVVFFPFVYTKTLERFLVESGDTMLGGREVLWQAGWQIISEHPLRGVGIGNSPFALIPYLGAWGLQNGSGAPIHNPILTIWCETGILGVILYLGVLIGAIWSFVRKYLQSRNLGIQWLMPYFALTGSVFLGFMVSWIKGGGAEFGFDYFMVLGLLLIPSSLDIESVKTDENIETPKK
jgi:O-antigen ligase